MRNTKSSAMVGEHPGIWGDIFGYVIGQYETDLGIDDRGAWHWRQRGLALAIEGLGIDDKGACRYVSAS